MVTKPRWVYGIMSVTLSIGLLVLLVGCPENGVGPIPQDGIITVKLTEANAHNDAYFYYAVVAAGADLNDPANWLGVAPTSPTIASGTVECITVVTGTNDPKTFTGGESYDVAGIIDIDLSGTTTNGDYAFGPETVLVDGNMILELVYPDDFVEVTGMPTPQDGTITVKVTGADAYNGVDFMGAVGASGADLNDPANWLADLVFPIVNGIGEGAAIPVGADPDTIPPPTPVTFTGGESYDVGGFIDANNDGLYTSGVDYSTAAVNTVTVDGNTLLELVYPTDFILAP